MNNAFEDAMHQGFSRADMAQELREIAQRIHEIGCDRCLHRDENSPVCQMIISNPERWSKCDYYCERRTK